MKTAKPKAPVIIPVDNIVPFEGHPYKVLDDDSMNELTECVQESGILEPLTVRPLENTENYEIISGHRRYRAAQKAGLTEVPAFIRVVSRDEAAIMLVDSNLHRERILPSEKAFAYKLKYEALKSQGKRSDLTSSQVATKLDTAAEVGSESGESRDTVYRYIRLTNLIPELLDMMDEGKIAFSVGVELSFLDEKHQYDVLESMRMNDCTPSYSQAVRMHKAARAESINPDEIQEILQEEKANQKMTMKIPFERIRKIVPFEFDSKEAEDYVVKALEYYHRFLIKQRERENER
ncbi:MAG: ParB/RepB/Spo0J family partition protein [Clostridia bacterium]|nr:ParB/RepB/Spo0J family partition protein [Clostridia bacterium]